MPKPPRNRDIVDRHIALERRARNRGPDRWIDMGQWLDEGYLIDIAESFQRFQMRRVGDWVEMRGYVEWDGNSNNPNPANPGGESEDTASSLVSRAVWWAHGPLPEEFVPPRLTTVHVAVDYPNANAPDSSQIPPTQALLITGGPDILFATGGEMLWRPVAAWHTVAPHFGFFRPLTVWCFDNVRYYVGDRNDEVPPEGYVQHWPNP